MTTNLNNKTISSKPFEISRLEAQLGRAELGDVPFVAVEREMLRELIEAHAMLCANYNDYDAGYAAAEAETGGDYDRGHDAGYKDGFDDGKHTTEPKVQF